MTTSIKLILAAAALGALSGCGLQGDLQRPDPLFGNPDDRDPAGLPDREVDTGLESLRDPNATPSDIDDQPDAEEELLGGPGN